MAVGGHDRPIRILHLLAPAPVGGLEQVVQALVAGQLELGMEVHIAPILDAGAGGNLFVDRVRQTDAGVHPLVLPPRAYRRERALVAALCGTLGPDVVHTHGYRPDVIDAPVARRLGVPTVTTVHGFTGGGWRNRAYEMLQRRAYRQFDAVVAVSRPLAASLAAGGVGAERIRCLPNAWAGRPPGIDRRTARQRLGVPEDGIRIGFVGRLSREKGADLFLDALGRLVDLDLAASIVGDGRMREEMEDRAERLGVGARVRWHGLVPDMGRLMPALDLLVLSSRTEGTPIVLFEAMAAATPVVATRVGGVPDVVGEQEALLVAPDAGQLAGAIRQVLADPDAARQRALKGRAKLECVFGVEPWLRGYQSVYRAVMERPRGVPAVADVPCRG
jgi:glycosyltransferase involved in cell wall biosynthesis